MAPYLWFYHDLRLFKVLTSHADGYAPLKPRTFLEADLTPMHDGPYVDCSALHLFPEVDKAFYFFTIYFYPILNALYLLLAKVGQIWMDGMH